MAQFPTAAPGAESNPSVPAAPSPAPVVAAPAPSVIAAPAPSVVAAPAPSVVSVSSPLGFHTAGPWVAGSLYLVVPTGPLLPIAEDATGEETPAWYCITRGHYVGVTLSNPLALAAVSGVGSSSMKGYKTQALALAAFNQMLSFQMVVVIP
ncbi:hypothetical protein B0H15DRAFT_797819 [Mycena belliarum]|uniref:Uncharacterized protein n=1 Tax=Mycena belliarum TaxID=1033014 RepID=A0AAD6XYF0_9AGAR|nr:hypothetical protein B0H15DRAFT_797819 [Mycena belliae]